MRIFRPVLSASVVAIGALGASHSLAQPVNYTLQTLIAIPATTANVQPGQAFTSFDIGFFNPASDSYYVADRSNASVDIIGGTTLKVLGQAQGFTGQ